MAASRKASGRGLALILGASGLLIALIATRLLMPGSLPTQSPGADTSVDDFLRGIERPDVRAFLGRVLPRVPPASDGLTGYRFESWSQEGYPTQEVIGLKTVPGVEPEAFVGRIKAVDLYVGNVAHVDAARSIDDPRFRPPGHLRIFQKVSIPGVTSLQYELVLVDAGTVRGYRVVYWYLLDEETGRLDRKDGARSAHNVGAWLVAPGRVGYALSSWPRRDDLNWLQWQVLSKGGDGAARGVVEGNIDGMAAWSMRSPDVSPTPPTAP